MQDVAYLMRNFLMRNFAFDRARFVERDNRRMYRR